MDLLPTCTHDSELQQLAALSLISTLHKSLPAKSSPAFCSLLWSLLGNSSQQWRFFIFYAYSIARWLILLTTEVIAPTLLVIASRHTPRRKHCSSVVVFVFVAMGTCLPSCCLEMAVAQTTENSFLLLLCALPSNGCCLHSHCLATGLYATVS
jgi:hypothetical protein